MHCESKHHHSRQCRHHHRDSSCCCGGNSYSGPSFWTRAEKIAKLEQYLEKLHEEAEAVKERIAALKGEE